MSQDPLSYASPGHYPPNYRPTAVTALAILGIIFGGLGVLCIGSAELFGLVALASPAMQQATAGQPVGTKIINLCMGLIGFVLCGILLGGSIGSLLLKPGARHLMVGWSAVDIVFDLLRVVIALVVLIPATRPNPIFQQNPAFRNNPNAPQIIAFAKGAGLIGALLGWVISTTYAALVLVFFRKPEIVTAFERNPLNPNPSLPPPPI